MCCTLSMLNSRDAVLNAPAHTSHDSSFQRFYSWLPLRTCMALLLVVKCAVYRALCIVFLDAILQKALSAIITVMLSFFSRTSAQLVERLDPTCQQKVVK